MEEGNCRSPILHFPILAELSSYPFPTPSVDWSRMIFRFSWFKFELSGSVELEDLLRKSVVRPSCLFQTLPLFLAPPIFVLVLRRTVVVGFSFSPPPFASLKSEVGISEACKLRLFLGEHTVTLSRYLSLCACPFLFLSPCRGKDYSPFFPPLCLTLAAPSRPR